MKKLFLFMSFAVMFGVSTANAQSCGDNSTYGTQGPCADGSVCGCQSGASDCAGPSCVNLQTSNNNCGSLGNKCDIGGGETCSKGVCTCEWDDCGAIGGGGIGPLLQSKPNRKPFVLTSKHDDIAIAVAMLKRKG